MPQEGERLQAAVDALAGEASPLVEATARRDEHAYDRGKFLTLLENLQVGRSEDIRCSMWQCATLDLYFHQDALCIVLSCCPPQHRQRFLNSPRACECTPLGGTVGRMASDPLISRRRL